jgi:predicted GIY-YIG superfamily endonuclease
MVYLIHFDKPFKYAKHYIGYCNDRGLKKRIDRHKSGDGAKLLRAVIQAGIDFNVVRTWDKADRAFERKLHKRKNTKRLCPVCQGETI